MLTCLLAAEQALLSLTSSELRSEQPRRLQTLSKHPQPKHCFQHRNFREHQAGVQSAHDFHEVPSLQQPQRRSGHHTTLSQARIAVHKLIFIFTALFINYITFPVRQGRSNTGI